MQIRDGYIVRVSSLPELGAFIEGFRGDALRLLTRLYGRAVAESASRMLDFHHCGIQVQTEGASPISDGMKEVRQSWRAGRGKTSGDPALDFDCSITFHPLTSGNLLARFTGGHSVYRKAFENRSGVERHYYWDDSDRPRGVSKSVWAARGRDWSEALSGPPLGRGLSFSLIDGALPVIKYAAMRRYLPSWEARVKQAARTKLLGVRYSGAIVPPSAEAHAEFAAWLKSDEGAGAFADCAADLGAVIGRTPEKDEFLRYGAVRISSLTRADDRHEPSPPRMIDHADIIESSDGRMFVAVLDAGFVNDSRVYIQTGESHITFMQNGRSYGHIENAPMFTLELLRTYTEATVVELQVVGSQRKLKAKHVAIVNDLSISDSYRRMMDGWRPQLKRGKTAEEIKEWMQ